MKAIKWIIAVPISLILLVLGAFILEWVLGWILKAIYFIMVWRSRFDTPGIFDFENKLEDFKSFIFVTCLSALISAFLAGYIGGKICPNKNSPVVPWLFGICVIPLLFFSCIVFWNSEHWFYSSLWILDMLLVGLIFIGGAQTGNENN